MEGLGITACSLECLACLNHVHGWTIWGGYGTLPQTPLSRSIDRSQVARRRVRILVTSGSLNSNSTSVEPAWFPSLCPVVMHSPVTGLFRVPWIGFFFPPSVPASKSNVRLGIPNRLSIQHCNVWSDGLCAKTLGKYCSCTSASVGRFFSAPPLDDMRSI